MARAYSVNLGDEARDSISGFTGLVVAVTEWLYGCRRIIIQPTDLDKDGKPKEGVSFDELQIEVTKAKMVEPITVNSPEVKTGGPRPDFPRR